MRDMDQREEWTFCGHLPRSGTFSSLCARAPFPPILFVYFFSFSLRTCISGLAVLIGPYFTPNTFSTYVLGSLLPAKEGPSLAITVSASVYRLVSTVRLQRCTKPTAVLPTVHIEVQTQCSA